MNAKDELLEILSNLPKVECAYISYWKDTIITIIQLQLNYTEEFLEEFLEDLNFEYEEFSPFPILNGTILLEGPTWITRVRDEENNMEWWKHMVKPEASDVLSNSILREDL